MSVLIGCSALLLGAVAMGAWKILKLERQSAADRSLLEVLNGSLQQDLNTRTNPLISKRHILLGGHTLTEGREMQFTVTDYVCKDPLRKKDRLTQLCVIRTSTSDLYDVLEFLERIQVRLAVDSAEVRDLILRLPSGMCATVDSEEGTYESWCWDGVQWYRFEVVYDSGSNFYAVLL